MRLPTFRRRAEASPDAVLIAELTAALTEAQCQCDARDQRIAALQRALAERDAGMFAEVSA